MYKVFMNDTLLILTEKVPKDVKNRVIIFEDCNILNLIKTIENKSDKYYVLTKNLEVAWQQFKSNFKVIEAAGGLVKNKNKDVLFIFRLGKWDLPKGKIEKNESRKTAAVRELEEECGIKKLEIIKSLQDTFHVFVRNNRYILKITHWFLMYSDYDNELIPQIEEDITEVSWKNKDEVNLALNNTYENIKLLFDTNLV